MFLICPECKLGDGCEVALDWGAASVFASYFDPSSRTDKVKPKADLNFVGSMAMSDVSGLTLRTLANVASEGVETGISICCFIAPAHLVARCAVITLNATRQADLQQWH